MLYVSDLELLYADLNTLLPDTDDACSLSLWSKNERLGPKGLNGGQGMLPSAVFLDLYSGPVS